MSVSQILRDLTCGDGLVFMGRERWNATPLGEAVVFADEFDLPELRQRYPEWRAWPLAPVSVVTRRTDLAEIPSGSLDYLVAFNVFDQPEHVAAFLGAARRVLRGAGALLLVTPDARFVTEDNAGRARALFGSLQRLEADHGSSAAHCAAWTPGRLAAMIQALPQSWTAGFEVALAGRLGAENIAVLSRQADDQYATGDLLSFGHNVYVFDRPFIRHVLTGSALEALSRSGRGITNLTEVCFEQLVAGNAAGDASVAQIIERRELNS